MNEFDPSRIERRTFRDTGELLPAGRRKNPSVAGSPPKHERPRFRNRAITAFAFGEGFYETVLGERPLAQRRLGLLEALTQGLELQHRGRCDGLDFSTRAVGCNGLTAL